MCNGGDHPRSTHSQENHSTLLLKKKNHNAAEQLANQICATTGTKISGKTVARFLKKVDYPPEGLFLSASRDSNTTHVYRGALLKIKIVYGTPMCKTLVPSMTPLRKPELKPLRVP